MKGDCAMSILLCNDTRKAVGEGANECESRSLAFERFTDPGAKARRRFFETVFNKNPLQPQICSWKIFLTEKLKIPLEDLLFGQLQSRLIVNAAGGVMENAGMCLDRFSGVPYIPGSAVKGCARRMAIQLLKEAETPEAEPDNKGKKEELLLKIALIFGWGDQDWSDNPADKSDFAYACGDKWPEVKKTARERIAEKFGGKNSSQFAGCVCFLPSYPFKLANPDLELDVITCHHQKYYSGDLQYPVAYDTENPVPVVFPAVAAGNVFTFAVIKNTHAASFDKDGTLLNQARQWLKQGLETFGLGGKTAAGYGWFDCSQEMQTQYRQEWTNQLAQERQEREAEAERIRKEAEEAARKAAMTPEDLACEEFIKMDDQAFAEDAKQLASFEEDKQRGFLKALQSFGKKDRWKKWKKSKKPTDADKVSIIQKVQSKYSDIILP